MIDVQEKVAKYHNTCYLCAEDTKIYVEISFHHSVHFTICHRCANELNEKLHKILRAGRTPRRKRSTSPRQGGETEEWLEAT